MTNEQATALLQMQSSILMMIGLVCRFLETHPLMSRAELADYVQEKASDWRGDAPYAVVISTFWRCYASGASRQCVLSYTDEKLANHGAQFVRWHVEKAADKLTHRQSSISSTGIADPAGSARCAGAPSTITMPPV